jgi:hypothetical protein
MSLGCTRLDLQPITAPEREAERRDERGLGNGNDQTTGPLVVRSYPLTGAPAASAVMLRGGGYAPVGSTLMVGLPHTKCNTRHGSWGTTQQLNSTATKTRRHSAPPLATRTRS